MLLFMRPVKINKIALSFFSLIIITRLTNAGELPSAGSETHIYFEADNFYYDKPADTMRLEGNVVVIEKNRPEGAIDRIMRAEEFIIHPEQGILKSEGAVVVEEGLNAIYGENVYFDRNKDETTLRYASASYGDWRIIEAKKALMRKKKHIYKKVKITNCHLEKPHYYIRFSKASIIPKERIFAYNGILYIKKIPVFYFPLLYRSLGTAKRYITYLDLGYDKRSGGEIKTTTVYRFNEYILGKLYLDYFTNLTFGSGLGFEAKSPNAIDLDIDGYRIKEPSSSVDRWGLTGGYNLNIKDSLSKSGSGYNLYSQSHFRLVSDPFFNNDFFRSNPYAVSPDKNIHISIVHQTKKTTSRISYIKNQTRLGDNDFFTDTLESQPKFDLSVVPFKISKIPFLNYFSGSFENTKTPEIGYFKKTARAKYEINKIIPVRKGVSILPSVFYDQEVILNPEKEDGTIANTEQWIGRWGTKLNLRTRIKSLTTDLTHSYTRRLTPNKLKADGNASDYGIDTHLFSVNNFIRPSRKIYLRLNTGFDIKDERGVYKDFSSRMQPVFFDLYYKPTKKFAFLLQDQYKPGSGNQSFVMQTTLGQDERTHFDFGLSNYKANPADYILNTGFIWKPQNKSWYIDIGFGLNAHINSDSDFKDVVLYSKRLMIYKEFHDFFATVTLRLRPGVQSVVFNLGLKFKEPKERVRSEREKERFKTEWKQDAVTTPGP